MIKSLLYSLCFSILCLTACIKNNPDPSWIYIDKWTLQANTNLGGNEGELTHNFTNAWVYINDVCLGVFELPVKIPVLKSGNVNFKIYPAVIVNGISATKKIYPFCQVYSMDGTLTQNQVTVINPVTQYVTITNFIKEDFEGTNVSFENDPNTSSASFLLDNFQVQPFNGNYYARVQLNAMDSMWVAYTTFNSYIPKGKEVFLEMDYYTTVPILTGLISISPSGIIRSPNIQVNKQDTSQVKWKKIYIELKELIGASATGSYFDHSFEAFFDENQTNAQILIDNLKIVYFP